MKHPKKRRAKLFAGKSGLSYKSIKVACDKNKHKTQFFSHDNSFQQISYFLGSSDEVITH